MAKILNVATAVQKAVFEKVLLNQISSGFWKNARPADHAAAWKDVDVQIGAFSLGVSGFEAPRNYNFVNPEFFAKHQASLMEVASTVDANITVKQLKKQLISLNQIIGSRLTEVGGSVTKLSRGRKQSSTTQTKNVKESVVTRKVVANIVEAETTEESI